MTTVLNQATEYGLNKNFSYKTNSFKVYNRDADHIYLSTHEVKKLTGLNLKSNIQQMGKHQTLCFRVMKTFQHITIPLHYKVIEILELWGYNIPLYSNSYSNTLLKKLGEMAQIDEEVLFIKNIIESVLL